ncbi:MAG TPA: LacI family DNA-binding transcriptional regulator [Armatimonadota bacterium]|nr:LacI family DNA-binding transcriptional regulator [Armatimonadota bacterium]
MDTKNSGMERRHIVTLADIAERCGVTKMTVSRALRYPDKQRPELTARIRKVAKELGYDPDSNHSAQQLAMRKYGKGSINGLIAVTFPHAYQKATYFLALHEGITEVLSDAGYGLLMVNTKQLESGLLPTPFRRGEIDGIITFERPECAMAVFDRLRQETPCGQPPTVSVISPIENCSNILADYQQGASEAFAHLLELGHRYCLYIDGWAPNTSPTEGWMGYRHACETLGYDPDRHIFTVPFGHELWELAFRVENHPYLGIVAGDTQFMQHPIIEMLRNHPEITAILAPNDASAIICYHMLQTAGYRVPEDISLIGYDDTDPLVQTRKQNVLTTVHMPLQAIGRAAAKLLVSRVTGEVEQDTTETLPTTLVVRETTAPARPR